MMTSLSGVDESSRGGELKKKNFKKKRLSVSLLENLTNKLLRQAPAPFKKKTEEIRKN